VRSHDRTGVLEVHNSFPRIFGRLLFGKTGARCLSSYSPSTIHHRVPPHFFGHAAATPYFPPMTDFWVPWWVGVDRTTPAPPPKGVQRQPGRVTLTPPPPPLLLVRRAGARRRGRAGAAGGGDGGADRILRRGRQEQLRAQQRLRNRAPRPEAPGGPGEVI